VRGIQRTRNLLVHPLKVDSMKVLQSMAVRWKTPMAIIPIVEMPSRPLRISKQAHEGSLSAPQKQPGALPSVCYFTIAG
jgi:hypothetical protein